MVHAREELADLYGTRRAGLNERLQQLEALPDLDPGPRAPGGARTCLRPRRRIRSRGDDARARRRAFPDHPYTYVALGRVWLEKAQPRADRVDLEQGARARCRTRSAATTAARR